MNQPLGKYVGNWLEVYESILVLRGEQEDDLFELSTLLSGAMIYLGNKASSIDEGIEISKQLIKNGKAFDKFLEIVKLQNGNISIIKHPEKYPKSKVIEYLYADKSGYIAKMDNYQIGMSALELGAGRKTKEDSIEPKAGLIFKYKIGDRVKKGDVLIEIRSESEKKINYVKENLSKAILLSDKKTPKPNLVKKVIK